MKFLLLNQCFYPDVAATGLYLTELAVELVERGHEVTVVASDRGYDDPSKRFARRETWRGIQIIRIRSLSLGKETRWRRALNFGSFLISCTLRLAVLPRFDAIVALTSPPLISFLGALLARLRGGKLFFWVMDLNPDEAVAAGWLNESSLVARMLESLLRFSLRTAERVIVLDRFMKQRILAKGVADQKVVVLPPWALSEDVRYDEPGRQAFRARHDLAGKYVVMYAGNHSPCHPLETLLDAARRLADHERIAFCFVGGGSEQEKVRLFAADHDLKNISCLPYQPLAELSGSLSAADLHAVVMGERFIGIVHPCKIYNILAVGSPVLYIGPDESHITDIAKPDISNRGDVFSTIYVAPHGAGESAAQHILRSASQQSGIRDQHAPALPGRFSRAAVLPALINVLESVSTKTAVAAAAVSQTSI